MMIKKHRLLAILLMLTVVLTMSFAAVPAYAAEGTAISTADDLKAMESNPSGSYYLANDIEVPAAAVAEEVEVLRQQAVQRFGGKPEMAAQLPAELFEAEAKRRVQVGLLLSTIIGSNELKVDEARVEAMIADIASAYEQPAEVVEYYAKNRQLTENIRNVVLEEQAVDAVLAKAKVTEKAMSFDELMQSQVQA